MIETPSGDSIAIRHMMFLSLSYDHRVIDGFLGGSFLRRVADYMDRIRGILPIDSLRLSSMGFNPVHSTRTMSESH